MNSRLKFSTIDKLIALQTYLSLHPEYTDDYQQEVDKLEAKILLEKISNVN